MTQEEVTKTFEELKSQGMKDDDLLVALGKMYQKGELTKDQLGALIDQLGYEFTDDFAGMSDEESKKNMFEEVDDGEPEPKDEEEEKKPEEEKPEPESESESEEEGDDEESEKKKAMGLFGR